MTLGQKLQTLRKEKGISQEKLAAELGVSRQAVSKWELDIALPETENIIKIGKIFEVSYDYLLADNGEDDISQSNDKAVKNTGRNIYIDNIVKFIKKYGYTGGYVLSAVSVYCLIGYSIALFGLWDFIIPPEGFSAAGGMGMTNTMMAILVFYIILSLAGMIGGLLLARFIKKKTEKYRVKNQSQQEN